MNLTLVAPFPKERDAFRVTLLPLLARLYRYAYHHQTNNHWELRSMKLLRKIFPIFRNCYGASRGQFEFRRSGEVKKISFNARNVQYLGVYATAHGYESEVAGLIDLLLPEKGTFFDIGSNWGYFTLYAAACRQDITIHAFEPLPDAHQDLTDCVKQAGLERMTTCHKLALSDHNGDAHIMIPDGLHSGSAAISSHGLLIRTQKLDTMGLPPPDFIKLDVENHEIEVLRGAIETLKKNKPYLVFENKPDYTQPDRDVQVLQFLKELGYELFVPAVKRKSGQHEYFMQTFWHPIIEGDGLGLFSFAPETRFLYQHELNIFACHKDRLPELRKKFKPWSESFSTSPNADSTHLS